MIPVLIVPVLTRPELLERMLESVTHPVGTLLVIDNGQVVTRTERPSWAERMHVLHMPTNLGVAGSWNLGIKATPHAPWWLVAGFDVVFTQQALAEFDSGDASRVLRLSGGSPPWCAFAIGEDVVRAVGLFDEALYPAFYEDNDYQRRCEAAGVPILTAATPLHHDNSSSLTGRYIEANRRTFESNGAYYRAKQYRNDLSEGGWTLKRRRELSWD